LKRFGCRPNGTFFNSAPPPLAALRALPAVNAITVNTVHGNERSIAAVIERFRPEVESMEGAGVHERLPDEQRDLRPDSRRLEHRRTAQSRRLAGGEALERLAETTRRILAET
jgi:hypothetical protein